MSNEATVQSSLTLRILATGNRTIQEMATKPSSFTADVSMAGGPTPGEILVALAGTEVVLSQLTQPGLCRFQNLGVDAAGVSLFGTAGQQYTWTNYVEVGVYVPAIADFVPVDEMLPGESFVRRLSRFLGSGFGGTAPGTSPATTGIKLWLKAVGSPCKCVVEAVER